ncbi:MAG TPA: ABC transporter permease [Phnomibacter sp.]|nr:ABC transporter permease [Phnomibacter sp.]
MFRNYFKIAWRNLVINKGSATLNILGLATGIAATTIILLWIEYEVRFEKFHENIDRIHVAYNCDTDGKGGKWAWNTTPKVMASAIQQDYPEVETTTRVNWSNHVLFSYGEKRIKVPGNIVDSTFLNVFSFPLVTGQPDQVLQGSNSLVLTESLAKQIFDNEDPIGKTLLVNNEYSLMVTGVLKDLPANTQFIFEFLAPWSFLRQIGYDDTYWGNNSTKTYVMLKEGTKLDGINAKLKDLRKKYNPEAAEMETFLYPFASEHLYGRFENGVPAGGRIEIIRMFTIIAAFVLLIACINFMNLSTARSEKRAREVGIRKTIGAGRSSLIAQFLGESVFISLISFLAGLAIVYMALPWFNDLVKVKLTIDLKNSLYWMGAAVIILFTGVMAGVYPAFYLSSFDPVGVLKGTFKKVHAVVTPRKVLVVLQFTLAIILIISTLIVRQQIRNAQNRQAGYDRTDLVYSFMEGDAEKNYSLIRQELLSSGTAVAVSKTNSPITENWTNTSGIEWQGKPEGDKTVIDRFMADDGIVNTVGLKLIEGRDLDLTKYPTDSSAIILNETALKLMGFKDPIGQIIRDDGRDWHVIGVVEDFVVRSPFMKVTPMVIQGAHGWFNVITVKLNPERTTSANLAAMEKIFKKFNPEFPFNYEFVDVQYANKFNDEKRTETLATLFAALAIIISCLGLFGLASYMAELKTKEIGIRKVLGASVSGITFLLSAGFLKLVLISFIIAAPVAWYAMHKWLQGYPYRIDLHWGMFLLAGALAMLIAFLTVSYQAIKAAVADPVRSLRTE